MNTPDETLVTCKCCGEAVPESEAKVDRHIGGPVCTECFTQLLGAGAWLKHCGLKEPSIKGAR